MGLPTISYPDGTGGWITWTIKRGPENFTAKWSARAHQNLATSGAAQETVLEAPPDILIEWTMPALTVNDDLENWQGFLAKALTGVTFKLYPNADLPDYYNCVWDGTEWAPARKGPKVYEEMAKVRVLQDAQMPAGPATVLRRLYGLTG